MKDVVYEIASIETGLTALYVQRTTSTTISTDSLVST